MATFLGNIATFKSTFWLGKQWRKWRQSRSSAQTQRWLTTECLIKKLQKAKKNKLHVPEHTSHRQPEVASKKDPFSSGKTGYLPLLYMQGDISDTFTFFINKVDGRCFNAKVVAQLTCQESLMNFPCSSFMMSSIDGNLFLSGSTCTFAAVHCQNSRGNKALRVEMFPQPIINTMTSLTHMGTTVVRQCCVCTSTSFLLFALFPQPKWKTTYSRILTLGKKHIYFCSNGGAY